jgi:hypothetical protein
MRGYKPFFAYIAREIKKIWKLLPIFFGKDFPVFLLFLAISFLFWWSRTMSRSYEMHIQYPVSLIDVPEKLRITNSPEYELKVTISGKGMSLWKAKNKASRPLHIKPSDFVMSSGHAAISTKIFIDSLEKIIPSSVIIKNIEPDSLIFNYLIQKNKMVPVRYSGSIESKNQYMLDKFVFSPDSVSVGMPVGMEDSAFTMNVDLKRIELDCDTIVLDVNLTEVADVISNVSGVRMTVISSQFTEKSIVVPIMGQNFPEGKILKSFPSKATVKFWVKLDDFDNVDVSDFKVVVDYNDIKRESDKVGVRLFYQPSNVTKVRVVPTSVSFLIEESRPSL